MNRYEKLLSEYGEELDISERCMKHKGLYADDTIWINKDLSTAEKACILAEEIGHYETSVGDILDQKDIGNAKQEYRARAWAYKKMIPFDVLIKALSLGYTQVYDMAEHLSVDEQFLRDCLQHYGFI